MSDLLRIALRANIPLVRVTSDDPEHLAELLETLSTRPVTRIGDSNASPVKWKGGHVYFDTADKVNPTVVSYDDLLEKEITFIAVNPGEDQWNHARDCGKLTPPVDFIQHQLEGFLPADQVKRYGRYFAGMSLKDTIETILITQARDGDLSSTGLNETKSYLGAGLEGLESLDSQQDDYVPPEWAVKWLKVEAPLLEHEKYRELWPKGFMLYGPTGTGKTALARYIASKLGWPLYRLDLGSVYSKWQGESEYRLRRLLAFISSQGESVFLLDEAEKLFGQDASQASLSTLLSMLLWWLQGPSNRTVTVMTANDLSVIPAELYRPGRLDAVHLMQGLKLDEMEDFVAKVGGRIAKTFGLDKHTLIQQVLQTYSGLSQWPIPQAAIVGRVRAVAKQLILATEGK